MGNDFRKQSSTISAKRALEVLLSNGFEVGQLKENLDIQSTKQAYRKDILEARRKFGEFAAISNTGRSITLVGYHVTQKNPVRIEVPLFGMLGHGALEAIQEKTGVTIGNS